MNNQTDNMPVFPLVDAVELAELFDVKRITILKWVERKQIPYYRMSDKCLRFDLVDVLKSKKIV